MNRILVISMAGIGDTILATPLIHELRAHFPAARLDALVLWAGSKDILEGNPHVTAVHQRNLLKQGNLASLRFLLSIRKHRYDLSINTHPQSKFQYRLIARIIGAPVRISHRYESFRAFDRLLVNRTLPQDYARHSVDLNLDVLGLLGKRPALAEHRLEVFVPAEAERWAGSFLAANGLANRPRLGIHAGSGGTKNLALKRWPLDNYIALVGRLRESHPDLAVIFFGGPDEDAEIAKVLAAQASPLVVKAGSPTLGHAAALMRRCTAFLSVDTALMHVAAAVQAPRQIVIEAFTLNKTNEPYGNPYTLVPNPGVGGRNLDFYRYDGLGIKGTTEDLVRLMNSVTVDAVRAAVAGQLAKA